MAASATSADNRNALIVFIGDKETWRCRSIRPKRRRAPATRPKLESAPASVKPMAMAEPARSTQERDHRKPYHADAWQPPWPELDGQARPDHIIGTGHAGPNSSRRAIHNRARRPVRDRGRDCWAAGFVAAKHGIAKGLSPTDLAFHRFVWSGLLLMPLVAQGRPRQSRRRRLAARAGHPGAGGAAAGDLPATPA